MKILKKATASNVYQNEEAFAAKKDIDVVVTAMGDFEDRHDLLSVFLKDSGQDVKALRRRGWLGNVQYRPFTSEGPVHEAPDQLRAVTVFELEDLVERAKDRSKEVILMARQCAICGRSRAQALLPAGLGRRGPVAGHLAAGDRVLLLTNNQCLIFEFRHGFGRFIPRELQTGA